MNDRPVTPSSVQVAALYCFAPVARPEELSAFLHAEADRLDIRGTIIIAREGINGTIAGEHGALSRMVAIIRAQPGFDGADVKWSDATDWPFARLKVKVKDEIVTLRAGSIDAAHDAGTHVDPQDWNRLISDPDTVVIDTRNAYEVAIGSFEGAIDPRTRAFADFPAWFGAQVARWAAEGRQPRIAMFCTGGIRCEKSTALARSRGFSDVYHLKGGILNYLEQVDAADSLWRGDCFVFDERVAITHGLQPGRHSMCAQCGLPVPLDGEADHSGTCAARQRLNSSP